VKPSRDDRLQQVRKGYTELLKRSQADAACCPPDTPSCCGSYTAQDMAGAPQEALQSSFGCGNPLQFAEVKVGQTVLDIGSGAGIDCFLAAQKVGPMGKVIGLDMTPAMIEKARQIAAARGFVNVEFRLGAADQMPVEDHSVDWIISNCVINLAPDKPAVFREAFRVLKPGGRLSVSDIVLARDLPEEIRQSIEAYVGCVAGAILEAEYLEGMRQAGFQNVEVSSHYAYTADDLRNWLGNSSRGCCGGNPAIEKVWSRYARDLEGSVRSALFRAVKPQRI